MRALFVMGVAFLALGVAVAGGAVDTTKLVGVWEVSKGEAPKGAKLEFTKDGKLTMTMKKNGEDFRREGTYKLSKNTIEVTSKIDGKTQVKTATITKLTDTVLILREKDKEVELKRVK